MPATQVVPCATQCVQEPTDCPNGQSPPRSGAVQPSCDLHRPLTELDGGDEHAGTAAAVDEQADERCRTPDPDETAGFRHESAAETAVEQPTNGGSQPGIDTAAEPERSGAPDAVETALAPLGIQAPNQLAADQAPALLQYSAHDGPAAPHSTAAAGDRPRVLAAPSAQRSRPDQSEHLGPGYGGVSACTQPGELQPAPRMCTHPSAAACAEDCAASAAADKAHVVSESPVVDTQLGGSLSISHTCGAWDRDIARVWVEVCDKMQAGCEESTLRQRVLHGDADCAARQCDLRLVAHPQARLKSASKPLFDTLCAVQVPASMLHGHN